ncbi:hypothetical protein U1Q18_010197 [Sarracenia purpurea var. burkii]
MLASQTQVRGLGKRSVNGSSFGFREIDLAMRYSAASCPSGSFLLQAQAPAVMLLLPLPNLILDGLGLYVFAGLDTVLLLYFGRIFCCFLTAQASSASDVVADLVARYCCRCEDPFSWNIRF